MKRHEFQPGPLIAGLVFIGLAVAQLLDAFGTWSVRWPAAVAFTGAGLAAAALAATANRVVRSRAAREQEGDPGSGGESAGKRGQPASRP